MSTRKPDSDGPEDVDAAFAAIIADLEREGVGRDLDTGGSDDAARAEDPPTPPDTDRTDKTDKPDRTERPRPIEPADPGRPSGWRGADTEWDPDWDPDWEGDEHYEPPEPPPLPKLHASTIVALVLIVIAIVLFVWPGVLGMQSTAAIPIAAVAVVGAAGLLLLRLRTGNPPGSPGSDDDGARL